MKSNNFSNESHVCSYTLLCLFIRGISKSLSQQLVGSLAYTFAHVVSGALVLTPVFQMPAYASARRMSRCLIAVASQALHYGAFAWQFHLTRQRVCVMTTSQPNQWQRGKLAPCGARCALQIFAYAAINCSHSRWLLALTVWHTIRNPQTVGGGGKETQTIFSKCTDLVMI